MMQLSRLGSQFILEERLPTIRKSYFTPVFFGSVQSLARVLEFGPRFVEIITGNDYR
jgi:hypothetical protein